MGRRDDDGVDPIREDMGGPAAGQLAVDHAGVRQAPADDDRVRIQQVDHGPEGTGQAVEPAVDGIDGKVARTVAAGAKAIIGGERPSGAGYFYPPTVLLDVPTDSAVANAAVGGTATRTGAMPG